MKIGIIGGGKMGKDLFDYLQNYDCISNIVVLCRREENAREILDKFNKQLIRKVKRELLTKEQANQQKQKVLCTIDYKQLVNCDIVIENVIEDLNVKQEVISKIAKSVSNECIIASNTSSLKLEQIFEKEKLKTRCIGMHFFFPLKILSTVEVGKMTETCESVLNRVLKFLQLVERKPLLLDKDNTLIISRILTNFCGYAYYLYRTTDILIEDIEEIFKKEIMMFGPFELMDMTGFKIIKQCLYNFRSIHNEEMFADMLNTINYLTDLGFVGNSIENGFLKAYKSSLVYKKENALNNKITKDVFLEAVKMFILKDIKNYIEQDIVSKNDIFQALEDSIGLNETYYREIT